MEQTPQFLCAMLSMLWKIKLTFEQILKRMPTFRSAPMGALIMHVWLEQDTVEPLLYDHPQNHIGVVV